MRKLLGESDLEGVGWFVMMVSFYNATVDGAVSDRREVYTL